MTLQKLNGVSKDMRERVSGLFEKSPQEEPKEDQKALEQELLDEVQRNRERDLS